jgi:hypothetical protein
MQRKKPLLITALVLLAGVVICFLVGHYEGFGGKDADRNAASPYFSDDSVFNAFYKRIEAAADSAQFGATAYELMAEVQGEGMSRLMQLLLDRWIEKDLAAALDFVSKLEEESIREALLRYAIVESGHLDFRGVLSWINGQPESKRHGMISLLYEGVAKETPEHALQFIDLLNDEEIKEHVVRTLLEQWAQRDMVAALTWMSAQTLPQTLDDIKTSLLSRLIKQYPQEAGALIRSMPVGHEKNTVARNYADILAKTDIQAAGNWARSLDDPDSYSIALTAVYEAWFLNEPDKKIIMDQVLAESDSELRDRLINEIALDIANSNPAELAHMIDRLPATSQPDVAEKAARFWKERDSRQTLNWLGNLGSGPVRDRVGKVMVEDFMYKGDKEGALALAATIGDKKLRYESVRKAVQYWYQSNPAGAQETINSISFLSGTEKEMLMREAPQ